MDFDERFGKCLPYERTASPAEEELTSKSMQTLSGVTAPALKNYLETAPTLTLTGVLHETTPILWLVDGDGQIRFALEEVVDLATQNLTYVLPRNGPSMRASEDRLGHPGLLDKPDDGSKKAARIGGEILYNPSRRSATLPWVITNNSGRFGKRPHINEGHLENVVSAFAEHHILLRSFFIYTPGHAGAAK
ncbi:hypothetical protein [Agrobacterium rosae]|uniref:Uncharacterized protein n=1 Tax=Agrobacterium rosae TaxID=1972867 RepID=A0A1R3U040_9HYPH|nr:hypothetical protein [Agrobacterium rosae]SCX31688.1 hypothetical protein DSM25559_3783 [Agrobacterium rosae]